jgi:hypothetical protein
MRPSAPGPDPYTPDSGPERIETAADATPVGPLGRVTVGFRRSRLLEEGELDPPAHADDVAVLEDGPRSVEFAAQPIGGGRRAGVPLVAFVIVVAGIAAVGTVGPRVTGPERPAIDLAVAEPTQWSLAAPTAATLPPAPDHTLTVGSPNPIALRSPAFGSVVVTSRRVFVEGAVNMSASRLEIRLEAPANVVLDTSRIDLPPAPGDLRLDDDTSFATSFVLPYPRPNGTLWISVTAFGPDGAPVGGIRRSFEVAPLLDAERRPVPGPVQGTPVNPPERG